MQRIRLRSKLWILCFLLSTGLALADGMVFPEVYYAKVEIPNQQALIHYSGGIERLVIETSFLAEGTNFAWVVPLPSAPEVKAVSESFFIHVQQAFQAELIHRVNPYYAGVLLVCGLAFLGSRALKDEVFWLTDSPLCALLAVGAGLIGRHVAFGVVALMLALCIRLFARSPATYALILLIGTAYAAILTFVPNAHGPHLFNTLGRADSGPLTERTAGVTVVSVQHAGLFETTTIRGNSPKAVLQWLERNGYQAPESAEPAIRQVRRPRVGFCRQQSPPWPSRIAIGRFAPARLHFSSPLAGLPNYVDRHRQPRLRYRPICFRQPPRDRPSF